MQATMNPVNTIFDDLEPVSLVLLDEYLTEWMDLNWMVEHTTTASNLMSSTLSLTCC
jgi:hypothetical protein